MNSPDENMRTFSHFNVVRKKKVLTKLFIRKKNLYRIAKMDNFGLLFSYRKE